MEQSEVKTKMLDCEEKAVKAILRFIRTNSSHLISLKYTKEILKKYNAYTEMTYTTVIRNMIEKHKLTTKVMVSCPDCGLEMGEEKDFIEGHGYDCLFCDSPFTFTKKCRTLYIIKPEKEDKHDKDKTDLQFL
jgi:hypothetical protein